MPGPLTKGGLNFGRNATLDVVINGQPFVINGLITETMVKPIQTVHTVKPTNNDGVVVREITYEGYDVEMKITRQNGQIDSLAFALQTNFLNGGPKPDITLTRTVRNPITGYDRQVFTDGIIEVTSLGTFKHDETVDDVSLHMLFSQGTDTSGNAGVNLNTPASKL